MIRENTRRRTFIFCYERDEDEITLIYNYCHFFSCWEGVNKTTLIHEDT